MRKQFLRVLNAALVFSSLSLVSLRGGEQLHKMLNQNCNHSLTMVTTTTTTAAATTTDDDHDQERSLEMATGEEETFSGREKLKRHRMEMGGRVWMPDVWGHDRYLKEWVDRSAFDSSLVPKAVVSAFDSSLLLGTPTW